MSDKRDWEFLYSSDNKIELNALELLHAEIGDRVLRDQNRYVFHTLACRKATGSLPEKNAVVIGTADENPLLPRFIRKDEIPAHGFRVRTVDNPEHPGKQLILIAGSGAREVLYGVITFLDDLIPSSLHEGGDGILDAADLFQQPFPPIDFADAPQTLVRSVFSWGHTVGHYRDHFRNFARMKINRVYLWNEYPPVNAAEVVEEAHRWGIEVVWGFAWGWSTTCYRSDLSDLEKLSDNIVKEWREVWSNLPGDGIYFQSFTEVWKDRIEGKSLADSVTELVNRTADRILTEWPELKIVYGLHATSVRNRLDAIAGTDPRLEILWEDCGGFPYKYNIPEDAEKDDAFTRAMFALKHDMGLVFKCQLMQKWSEFVHQAGPYVEGLNGPETVRHDLAVTTPMWRAYDALWLRKGRRAYELAQLIHSEGGAQIEMNIAAQLNGPVRLPSALTAELFWSTAASYEDILGKVVRRSYVSL